MIQAVLTGLALLLALFAGYVIGVVRVKHQVTLLLQRGYLVVNPAAYLGALMREQGQDPGQGVERVADLEQDPADPRPRFQGPDDATPYL